MNKVIILSLSVLLSACASENYVSNVTTTSHQQEFQTDNVAPPTYTDANAAVNGEQATLPVTTVSENKTPIVEQTAEPSATQVSLVPPSTKQLQTNPRYGFTVQLIATSHAQKANQLLAQLPNNREPLWQNEKTVNNQHVFAILYGDYATSAEAKAAIATLPKAFQHLKPFVKSFDVIKNSPYPVLNKLR